MAKGRAPKVSSQSRGSSRKAANALGYAKRQNLKSKTLSAKGISDVYEYQQDKVRRSKVKPLLERDETMGGRGDESGSEEEGDVSARRRDSRPRLVGENDDDGGIGEDEDEDIDSDEAFDESDEERYAGFSFANKGKAKSQQASKKKKTVAKGRSVRFADVDLNEDSHKDEDIQSDGDEDRDDDEEEEEEDGDPSEFIDILDVLDGRGEPDLEDDQDNARDEQPTRSRAKLDEDVEDEMEEAGYDDEDEDEDEEESGEDEEQDGMISASEVEDDGETALQDLESFVSGLDAGQKRKAPDDEEAETGSDAKRSRKRRILRERTETGLENEFAPALSAGKLNLDDLLAPLEGQSSNLQSLKKSAKVLSSTSGKIQTLSAPLPQRVAERLDREAAYEQTKEEVDKWKATMQRIKEAEHLSFPLQAEPKSRTSNLELAAKFKPTTELESAVDKLLKSAKMREDEIAQTESLKMNHLSVEEVATRRAELAKMRDLMFRAEAKAKRLAKIKSKTYRRLRKKERARLAEKLGEGEDAEDPDDEEAQMRREVERARERATLRHKNTGKWAKAMRSRGEIDEDQRRDINEMLDRGEKLRRKIQGQDGSGEEEESDDESDGMDGEEGISRIKAKAFAELATLDTGEPEVSSGKKGKSIFEMKFMKDAMAREQHRTKGMVDDFIREMGGDDPDDDEPSAPLPEETQEVTVQRVGGRVVYRPGALTPGARPVGSLASDTSSVTLKSTDLPPEARHGSQSPPDSPASFRPVPMPDENSATPVNPWLAQAGGATKGGQTRHEVAVARDSGAADKSKAKLRKRAQKRADERDRAQEDAAVDISLSTVMTLPGPSKAGDDSTSASKTAKGKVKAKAQAPVAAANDDDDSDSDANSELEEQERAAALKATKGKGKAAVKAFEQRDLVALAFAGDNVVQDFAEAKRREIAEDAPKEVDTTLPGWGSWGGTGTKKAPPKPHLIQKRAGVDPTARADHKKAHVIISEKRDKKAARYLVKDLPYPYTSRAQFARSMEVPLGTEWNTRVGFQRATLPKVVTKMGTLITPLEKHS